MGRSTQFIGVVGLGRVEYARTLALQESLVELRRAGAIGDVLLLLEHPPVLTLGRAGSSRSGRANILASDEELARRGVALHVVKRGGDVTYHGPGQLVGYPIVDLREQRLAEGGPRMGVVDFVRLLEETLIRVVGEYGLRAGRICGRTGVWTLSGGSIPEKKLAAIGIHVSRGVTSHGFALNVTTDLRDFGLIVPCGIADRAVTSLEEELGEPLALREVADKVARSFGRVFGRQILAVEAPGDLHPSLVEWSIG